MKGFGFEDGSWMERLRDATGPRGTAPARAERGGLGAIGGYELLERAGAGGQGTVYRARQPRTGRIVAIKKVALADGEDDHARSRFRREVELAAGLQHPGIVTVHAVLPETSAVVMEWVEGETADRWADRVRAGGLRRIVEAARRACEAVAFAHGRGVIHRDLKPSNILVDAQDRAHVVDFGLARDVGGDGPQVTLTGTFAGTPAYAPPEQIDRGLHDLDVRADVYAMGAVLYRMLTGREPFEAPTLAALFDRIRRGGAPAPSSLEARVDGELELIVQMAMRGAPEERYATMAGLGEDLSRWLERRPVRAHPPSPGYLVRAFVRRHRAQVAVGASAAALIVGLGVYAGVSAVLLDRERDRLATTLGERDAALAQSEASRDRASLELLKSMSSVELLFRLLRDDDLWPGDRLAGLVDALDRQAERLDTPSMPVLPAIEVGNRLTLARAYEQIGRRDRSLRQAELAAARARAVEGAEYELSEALSLIGELAMDDGRHADAVPALREALALRAEFIESAPDIARGHLLLLEALARSGAAGEAQTLVEGFPPTPGPAGAFMGARLRSLCAELGLTPPAWAAGAPGG